jgi:hypothetical protein
MTVEERKLIFGYMGWLENCEELKPYDRCWKCPSQCDGCINEHPLDGNDMVTAINKMNKKGDLENFYAETNVYEFTEVDHFVNLTNPTNFFNLMSEALKKGILK